MNNTNGQQYHILGNLKQGKNCYIPHLGEVKFIRLNDYGHAVIYFSNAEHTISSRTKVKLIR